MCSPCGLPQGFNHKDAATKHHPQVGSYFICITMKQENFVLDFFKCKQEPMSPSMVHKACNNLWPLTSVRRAITNLSTDGDLIKTNDTVIGIYGKPEHLWKLNV